MKYRLKTIFVLTSFVAVLCMVLFTLPDWPALIVLAGLATITPGALVAGIVYGRGAKRAFAMGSLASGGWVLWITPYFFYATIVGQFGDADDATMAKLLFVGCYGVLTLAG